MILWPHLVENLREKFSHKVLEKITCRTTGALRFKVIHPDQHLELIDPEFQSRHRSKVRMILYSTK
jgi:hypothetical protein